MLQFFKVFVKKLPPFNSLFATIAMKEADNAALQADNMALQADNAALQADNTALQADNTVLQSNNTALQTDHSALQEECAYLKKVVADMEAWGAELQARNAEFEQRNIQLQTDRSALQEECTYLKKVVADVEAWGAELQTRNAELEQLNIHLQEELDKTIQIGDDLKSGTYWEDRYRSGGNSGTGSYGKWADFKAFTVNTLTADYQIARMVEIGCGDGNQFKKLNVESYTGVDVSETVIERHRTLYAKTAGKAFYTTDEREAYIRQRFDASLSMDVVFHLLEQPVFEQYMDDLFFLADRYVIIYSSNHESYTPWPEFRHRKFTHYIKTTKPEWQLVRYIPNPYPYLLGQEWGEGSESDFYVYKRISAELN